jgi:hypothetical protein
MAAHVDEQHRASMADMTDRLAEVHFGTDPALASGRRGFLRRAATGGAIAFGATLVPVSRIGAAFAQEAPTPISAAPEVSDDVTLAVFATSVELAAVAAYEAAGASADLDAGAKSTAQLFGGHHSEHAAALTQLLTDNGYAEEVTANAALLAVFAPRIQGAADQAALAQVLYDLEDGAASTYLFAMGAFESAAIAGAAATILPVEAQHAVAWSLLIEPDLTAWAGNITTYVPPVQTVDAALTPAQFPVA